MSNIDKSYGRGQVVQIIQSVIQKMDAGSAEQQLDALKAEIIELATTIEKLKKDIEESSPGSVSAEHIPNATDELDAVVESTADATNSIMSACEKIQKVSEVVGGKAESVINDEVTKIYEACSFQDITGQRISKVVGALKDIDYKISNLIEALHLQVGPITEGSRTLKQPADVEQDNDQLINGPQMPDKAISQDDIDKLLAEFD